MLASFLLALREGLEGALIISILLAALRRTGRDELSGNVWRGTAMAVIFSLAAGLALNALGAEFEGRAEEIFEGVTMLLAAALLTWVIFWMRRQAVDRKKNLETGVTKAAKQGNGKGLFWLAFLAVGREGLELALFLLAAGFSSTPVQTLGGAGLGLALAVTLGWGLFASSRKLRLDVFFKATNVVLVLFAAGLLAHGVHEFNEAGLIPSVIEHVWDLNPILNEKGVLGSLLTALFGYNGNPSLSEVLAYLAYFVVLGFTWKKLSPLPMQTQTA